MGTKSLAGLHVQKHMCNQCLFTENKSRIAKELDVVTFVKVPEKD